MALDLHAGLVAGVFAAVYLGMAMGRWPFLRIDRTGVALVGAIALVALAGPEEMITDAVDFPTIATLFGLMVLSAQFAQAGFYDWCAARLGASDLSPQALLGLTVAVTGILASVLANDIVVFAMTPLLCRGLLARGRDPRPYLLAHAGAANAGSAATLIGNPQNILIGEYGGIDFWRYLAVGAPAAILSLALVYLTVWLVWRRRLTLEAPAVSGGTEAPRLDRFALLKAAVATALLFVLFATDLARWQSVLLIAGMLLISRRFSTGATLRLVDWHLLVLFVALFVVTGAFGQTDFPPLAIAALERNAIPTDGLASLAALSILGSNTVGNVPLVMLVLSAIPGIAEPGLTALAVFSTLAGNLFIVGSVANIIVAERCRAEGVALSFADHARSGVPMTLATLAVSGAWLAFVAG